MFGFGKKQSKIEKELIEENKRLLNKIFEKQEELEEIRNKKKLEEDKRNVIKNKPKYKIDECIAGIYKAYNSYEIVCIKIEFIEYINGKWFYRNNDLYIGEKDVLYKI